MPSVLGEVADALARSGIDAGGLGLAWARVVPTVVLVPAFGLRALPTPTRALLALSFAVSFFPAVAPVALEASRPWLLLALIELGRGVPVAIAAAVPLWAATMAGGVADALRGAQDAPSIPTIEGRPTPLGIPFSLLASAIYLRAGGPARTAVALAIHPLREHPLLAAVQHLVGGIALAVALGGPLLAAAIVIELAAALVARAASPAQVHALLAPLRALGTLAVIAAVLERLAAAMARAIDAAP